ncbi:MAG: hypothetical protein ACXWZQ_08655 [Candidatus Binatia bacterium]
MKCPQWGFENRMTAKLCPECAHPELLGFKAEETKIQSSKSEILNNFKSAKFKKLQITICGEATTGQQSPRRISNVYCSLPGAPTFVEMVSLNVLNITV